MEEHLLREVNPLNDSQYLEGLVFVVACGGYLGKPKEKYKY